MTNQDLVESQMTDARRFLEYAARAVLFGLPPFRWFFEREVFAVGEKI